MKNARIVIITLLGGLLLLKYNKYALLLIGIGYMVSGIILWIAKNISNAIEKHREMKEHDKNH